MKNFFLKSKNFLKCIINFKCLYYSIRYLPQEFHVDGTNYTLVTKKNIIKIPNKKRIKNLEKEFLACGIWKIIDKYVEAEKFRAITKKEAYVNQDGVLFLERLEAKPLSSFLDNEEVFIFFFEKSIVLLQSLAISQNFSHSDFHIDNILIDRVTEEVIFIDYDYIYTDTYFVSSLENDVVFLLFLFKKRYPLQFMFFSDKIRKIVEKHFSIKSLEKSMQDMQCFFQMSYEELW